LDERPRRFIRIAAPILIWAAVLLVVGHGRWQDSGWNLVTDVVVAFVVIPGLALLDRPWHGEGYRRLTVRWQRDWPILFWACVVALGIGLLAAGFTGQGVAVLVIPALVFTWAALRKVTEDPWK
jgi:hypothetical protein